MCSVWQVSHTSVNTAFIGLLVLVLVLMTVVVVVGVSKDEKKAMKSV
jgi:hypothetical protein